MSAVRRIWHALTRPRSLPGVRPRLNRARRRSKRGIAMLMVITTVAFIIVLVSEVTYASNVRLQMAAHERDEAAAHYLALSGVSLYRLILVADKQMSDQMGEMTAMFGGLWQMVPAMNTGLLRMFFVSGGSLDDDEAEQFREEGLSEEQRAESRESSRFADKNFLDFDGDFAAEISDEDAKINIKTIGNSCRTADQGGACTLATLQTDPVALQLFGVMSGQENDQWFYERNIDRWEIIANLADWVDQDTTRIFRGGYEDALYQNLDSPYLCKNAPFDTLQEVRLVDGWQDEVWERFGDKITIYGAPGKVNINTASDEVIKGLIRSAVTPMPSEDDLERHMIAMQDATMIMDWQSGKAFVSWLTEDRGLTLREGFDLTQYLKTESETFLVQSTGMVGDTTAQVTAVFDFSSSKVGRVSYWRND